MNKLLYILSCVVISSCGNSFYVQKSVFVPMLKEKHEFQAEGNVGLKGANLHAAYATGEHTSVVLGGFSTFTKDDVQYKQQKNIASDAAFGTHFRLFKNDTTEFNIETHIGFGIGSIRVAYQRENRDYGKKEFLALLDVNPFYTPFSMSGFSNIQNINGSGTFYTVFLQSSVGICSINRKNRSNEAIFTFRLQQVQFTNYTEALPDYPHFSYGVKIPKRIFLQTILTDNIKITNHWYATLQLGVGFDMNAPDEDFFNWNGGGSYIGIKYRIASNEVKKQKKLKQRKSKYKNRDLKRGRSY